MEKNRLEAFSDGVLAIIITIMILEMKQPVSDRFSDFIALGPTLSAYMLSFIFIAIYWVNHHQIFRKARRINIKILWCNIIWLFVMSFIPFATAWVGTYPTSLAPVSIYFTDMLLTSVAFHLLYYFIIHENGEHFKLSKRNAISLLVYLLASLFGGFYPLVSFIIVAIVTCWWIMPEKIVIEEKNKCN